eukprot:4239206-Amphidinium_carterae.1
MPGVSCGWIQVQERWHNRVPGGKADAQNSRQSAPSMDGSFNSATHSVYGIPYLSLFVPPCFGLCSNAARLFFTHTQPERATVTPLFPMSQRHEVTLSRESRTGSLGCLSQIFMVVFLR